MTSQQSIASEITVYKSATCGCCTGWVNHLKAAGFEVTAINSDNMGSIKQKYGVSDKLASCHTAIVDGYILEGHVPADDVVRLLKEKPAIAGLTAPGMPMQSPGMQPEGLAPKNYDVIAFDKHGKTAIFSHY
ncbi:MAG: DUF411 domain-containing protein [Ghiorsea sp.]